jgi:hypothetical protein
VKKTRNREEYMIIKTGQALGSTQELQAVIGRERQDTV